MRVLGVGEVSFYLKELLRTDELLNDVWVSGEVTNLSRSGAGHYYFSLKDDASQLRSVLFRGAALRCGAEPRAGDAVVAHGKVDFYEPTGSCQLCVDLLYPSGVGLAQLRFEALRLKLEEEGLFADERKRSLPTYPRRIGLLTSEGGAVVHDVLTVLARRYPLAEIVFAPSAVQGDHAPGEIVAALAALGAWRGADGDGIDVVIIGRGGGSPEELAAFNDERVARAVFASPWPIISAVGHETDVTICDYVADVRAPTPSAAAELVAPNLLDIADEVRQLVGDARVAIERVLDAARSDLGYRRDRLLVHAPLTQIAGCRQATRQEIERARIGLAHRLSASREQIAGRRLQLAALSPLGTLARGYGIVSRADDGVVRSVRDVGANQGLEIRLVDGLIEARSTGVRTAEEQSPTGSDRTVPAAKRVEDGESAGKPDRDQSSVSELRA